MTASLPATSPRAAAPASELDQVLATYLLRRERDRSLMPGVFADELPDHLRSRFLAEIEALAEIDGLADAPPRDLPKRLGNFRIVGQLGEGATGTVYEAEQVSLGRRVAIKVLHNPLSANHPTRRRFAREARLAASLQHAAIVHIHDFAEIDGRGVLVMELARGHSLHLLLHARQHEDHPDHTEACRLLDDPQQVATTFAAIASAVAFAHQHGVVHRDLKPANLMIDGDGSPTVLDFGLAFGAGDREEGLTRTGAVLGTPLYMAPEQLRGDRTGPPTDVWALGCVLLECLTGRAPAGPFSIDAEALPARLAHIIARCLDRDPERRYRSATELANDLAAFAACCAHRRSWRWSARHKSRVRRAFAAAVIVGLLGQGWFADSEPAATQLAPPPKAFTLAERVNRIEAALQQLAQPTTKNGVSTTVAAPAPPAATAALLGHEVDQFVRDHDLLHNRFAIQPLRHRLARDR